ncbi:MAG: lamin tail domain-containing protein [Saprospiraceae bacterium]
MNKPTILHLSRCVYFMLFFLLWSLNVTAQGDLFFSEYVESKESGLGNKCLEMYNPTSNSLNLSDYTIEFYNNGSNNPSTAPFTIGERVSFSKLAPFQTVVLCQPASDIGLLSVSDGTFKFGNYNGNDAIVLRYNGAIVDIIGAIGCNPGEAWTNGGNSTKDNTLVRKACIQKGNSTGDCAFAGLASEWVSLGANNFSNLGTHETGVPLVKISGNNALCENPSITLTATAGFASYEWSNGGGANTTTISTPGNYSVTITSDIGCRAIATKTINGQSPAINATIANIQAVSCIPKKDGSFTVTPSGGSGGFSYAWETGASTNRTITGLGAGNYTVTVTDDNGCSVTQAVTIEGTVTVPLTSAVTPETCKGREDGTITLSGTGNGVTYAINNNAFQQDNRFVDLTPGDYVVQVQDASGCGNQQSVTIPAGSNFNLRNSQIVQASCQGEDGGGQIILRPEGGQTPYQFSVDGSPFSDKRVYSNLKGGIYNIIVKDASGCEKTFQQEMEEGSNMVVDSLIISPAICEGVNDGAVQILLSGGSGNISYNKRIDGVLRPFFSPTFIGLSSGNHQVIIRDNEFDCRIPVNFEIPIFRTLTASIQTAPLCESATTGSFAVIPQNGFSPYEYSLDSNAFVSDSLFQEVELKNYVVTTKDYDGCTTTDSVNFADGLSFEIVFAVPRTELCVGNEDGQITVVANGMDSVSYSIDDINYSENNVFAGLAAGEYTIYAKAGDCMATETVTILAAEAIRLEQITPQIASCEGDNDGQLTIDIAGGVAPYTYQLDQGVFQDAPVFSNLTQGVYSITVRDANQCEQVFTDIILPGPVRLDPECSVTQQVTTAGGSDGSASMIIFGGMPPYYVQLLDAGFNNIVSVDGVVNFDNLSAGNYIAEVRDANDCTNTCEFTIEEPQCDFSISASQTNATCFDSLNGTINLTIPAQNLPLTINWSDTTYNGQQNLTGLTSGEYRVTVTDALGCVDSTAITITEPAPLNVRIETVNTTICSQDSTELVLTGMYANYTWSNEATTATTRVYETGNYQIIVEDEMGCIAMDEIAITVLQQDTIRETRFTCDAMNIGTFMTEERNENGCNNIILRTFELARKDTTYIAATTCNPSDAGMFQTFLPNILGCDSLIITTVELLRSDTTYQTLMSCNSEEVGVNETVLTNQFGCDSLLIIETTLVENLPQSLNTNFTCNAMEVGLDTAYVKTITGCDSLSITQTISNNSEPTLLTEMTCDATIVGIDTLLLMNEFLCDSLVIIATRLNSSHVISLMEESCQPADTGIVIQSFVNQFGCDSIITTYTTLSPVNDCDFNFTIQTDSICRGETTGTIQLRANAENSPLRYYLLDDLFRDTLQEGRLLDAATILTNIPVGEYWISVVNERGFENRQRLSINQFPTVTINAQLSDYNGFAISCIDETDGSIEVTISDGKAPYTYLWEDDSTTKERQNLAVGDYRVTVVDANNCTDSTTFNLAVNEALSVEIQTSNTSCFGVSEMGQLTITDLFNANGPAEYSLDGLSFQPIGQLPYVVENLPLGTYELYIQDENDCQTNTDFTIPISTEKQLTLGGNQVLSLGDSLLLTPITNFDITRFEWTSTTTLPCTDCPTIRLLPIESGQYTLTAYDANDCSLTASVAVRLEKKNRAFIPNVFSPNNDGVNDVYQVFTGKSVSRINQFQIFDYEGRLMYQINDRAPNDTSIGWDGRFNGQKMSPAVFAVLMEVTLIDGTTKQYRETMTLIK